jgi:DNA-binding transcriptional regulator YhcF (GntR family)
MDFRGNEAIYIQIGDLVCDDILRGTLLEGSQAPSIRELSYDLEVNPKTVMRTYEILQSNEILELRRGLGLFVTIGAKGIITNLRKQRFIKDELPLFFNSVDLLNIDARQIISEYKKYKAEQKNAPDKS